MHYIPSLIPQDFGEGGLINKEELSAVQFLQVVKALYVFGTEGNIVGAIPIIGRSPKLAPQEIEIARRFLNIWHKDADSKKGI